MPEDGENSVIVFEFDEVKDESVDDAEGQSIFLVEKRLDEDAVGAGVLHLRQLKQGGAGMRKVERLMNEYREKKFVRYSCFCR